jgi:hypothetical protein
MKTIGMCVLVVGIFVVGTQAHAISGGGSNLVQNPHFDSDISPWLSSSGAFTSWTGTQDHHDTGSSGVGSALVTSAGAPEFLTQCISVQPTFRYFASGWAKSTCGHAAQLNLFWADADCTVSGIGLSASTSLADTWQELAIAAVAPDDRDVTAVLVLQNTGECHDNSYFDDVLLIEDDIFENGFESRF